MKGRVNFFTENISYIIKKKEKLRTWIITAIEREGKVAGDINIILCDDDYLSELNYKYLKHKSLTDILTFPFDDETSHLCGDIFISLPRVLDNARKFEESFEDELHRVMIHGVLHLGGYHDSTKMEKTEMRIKEDFYLALLHT